jgi:hypothetical protein
MISAMDQTPEFRDEALTPSVQPAAQAAMAGAPFSSWLRNGLRAGFLLRPRLDACSPAPWQLVTLLVLSTALHVGMTRLEVVGPAAFNHVAFLTSWWTTAAELLVAWLLLTLAPVPEPKGHGHPIARWMTLWMGGMLPFILAATGFSALVAHGLLQMDGRPAWVQWGVYVGFFAWLAAIAFRAAQSFLPVGRAAALAVAVVGLACVADSLSLPRTWYSTAPRDDGPRLELSQEVFEQQQALFTQSAEALAPQRPGVVDAYGIVFAPYAPEDVFLREITMVASVLETRFDATGRVLKLVNNAATTSTQPWATPLNLQRAIQAMAKKMDPNEDVLTVYMTSHGASDFRMAASHWPLNVDAMSPAALRKMLDDAGIRNRVIAISACYSGGWIEPLAGDTTLVMTAADPTHTSYGCGRLSELTFFGRALFDEQLRKTRSFEEAFAAAVPVIKQREEEAGKTDGFSNPQIKVGEGIRPVLKALEERLAGQP